MPHSVHGDQSESSRKSDVAEDFNVGIRLRALRKAKGMRIEEVAQQVGVSKSFISRLERNVTQASIATLLRVCEVVGITPSKLFDPPSTNFVRAGQGTPISLGGENMREYLISGAGNEEMMVLFSEIDPAGGSGTEPYTLKAAQDMVHVLSGSLEVVIEEQRYVLSKGDTLTFKPSLPHTWRNTSATEVCTAIWVIVPPPMGA
ncbi:helix-turn-helix domain-containing protein [Affinibrenneria salicis]|uniref:Helix-turn-helix domain-containing protein n=1 Tax=Affinibrenneria salicis TaxID=2590031 RepID=A0A5J5G0W7_9GAMM|nr:XRE family transcriptional regulator [Affinibrenneria salicis]KAA8999367.1 helix-turn-helix domain-containing protein [Affinibrenneria salicis]